MTHNAKILQVLSRNRPKFTIISEFKVLLIKKLIRTAFQVYYINL